MSQFGNQSKSYLDQLLRQQRYNLTAIGYQQLVVGGTAVALTVPADATYALIEVESDLTTPAIRYLELGNTTLPTASTGIRRSNLDGVDIDKLGKFGESIGFKFGDYAVGNDGNTYKIYYRSL